MVTAGEIDKGRINEDIVLHTKEFGMILYIKRSYCKFSNQGMSGTKNFKRQC